MQSNAIYLSYKPLEIQSNYSVSNERKEIYTQTIQNQMEEQGLSGTAEWYIAPESFIQAHSYLTSNIDNPLSFKSTLEQEQSLVSKATSQMQDFLISPHLAILKENQSMDFTGKIQVLKILLVDTAQMNMDLWGKILTKQLVCQMILRFTRMLCRL